MSDAPELTPTEKLEQRVATLETMCANMGAALTQCVNYINNLDRAVKQAAANAKGGSRLITPASGNGGARHKMRIV